jgi:hypothetical protein
MNESDLEKEVIVNLYKVVESGYMILHDTPCLGVEHHYNHWSKNHGAYRKESKANKMKKQILEKFYSNHDYSSHECNVEIEKLTIPESRIQNKDGKLYYLKGGGLIKIK